MAGGSEEGAEPYHAGAGVVGPHFRTLVSHQSFFKYSSDMIWFTFLTYALESGLPEVADW